jgi:hypothetical protein
MEKCNNLNFFVNPNSLKREHEIEQFLKCAKKRFCLKLFFHQKNDKSVSTFAKNKQWKKCERKLQIKLRGKIHKTFSSKFFRFLWMF